MKKKMEERETLAYHQYRAPLSSLAQVYSEQAQRDAILSSWNSGKDVAGCSNLAATMFSVSSTHVAT